MILQHAQKLNFWSIIASFLLTLHIYKMNHLSKGKHYESNEQE